MREEDGGRNWVSGMNEEKNGEMEMVEDDGEEGGDGESDLAVYQYLNFSSDNPKFLTMKFSASFLICLTTKTYFNV